MGLGSDDLGRFVDFEQAQAGAAGDVKQYTSRAVDGHVQQRAADGALGGIRGPGVAAGFADSVGDEEYNLALSERRAASFKDYLVNNFGIDANRIVTLWYGERNPVADNTTTTPAARRADINADYNEQVTCTFTNTAKATIRKLMTLLKKTP